MCHLGAFDTRDGENTALLNFTQERGFFAQRGRYGNTQYHFVYVICQLGRCRIQIKFNFWLPIFLENVRRVRRFERDILGINTLIWKVISVLFCSDMCRKPLSVVLKYCAM